MGRKILVLEDERDIGELYVKCLKERGYDPILALDGFEGLEHLKTMSPDLILLDLGMPNMNGIEFYQHLCDAKGKPMYPVLVLTGRTDLEALFKDFDVEGFIIKPFRASQLLQEVDIIFNKHHPHQRVDGSKRIVIVDDDAYAAQQVMAECAKAGYHAEIAASAMSGIEKIMADPPDAALVKLKLPDLPGDLMVLRLQAMAKTRYVGCVLYVEKNNFSLEKTIKDNFSTKSGVSIVCEYLHPQELLEALNKVLHTAAA